ncbi:MAG: hypothetical protein K0B05_05425, partial [Bacteroidales bacterium]|nr:hypothetical protein [Bacteroidales bacterium]
MNYCLQTHPRIKYLLILSTLSLVVSAQNPGTDLETGFTNPPESAKPRTWWHWTNSNVTLEGITKDLEWMKRVGIGGFQLADVASGQGQTVDRKITFRSPEWIEAVRHAASEADRLGLEMAIFSSAGWSLTGGPWVKPEQAMKKLVWSETGITGPQNFSGVLPAPPSIEGPIRNLSRGTQPGAAEPDFYRDCIVLALPTPQDEAVEKHPVPVVITEVGEINPDPLLDDDLNSSAAIRSGKGRGLVWIEYRYDRPFTARALTMANRAGIPFGNLRVSDDGINYHTVLILPGAQLYRSGKVATYSFPAVTARYFRLEFTGAPMRPADVMAESETMPDSVYTFGEMKFHTGARINRWEDKSGFYHLFNYEPVNSDPVPSSSIIDPAKIIDLTSMMLPDGSINWKVPEGNWTIMRFGYSLTGARNRPAVAAGLGYEVDKLSREHTEAYIAEYMRPVAEALGDLYGKSLQYVLLDSWEAGMQNWTDNMLTEFRERRGYDLTPYLPCLAGWVVGSSEISDRVLWDFRRTLADMFAGNHYKVLTEYLNKQGIKTYGEASGVSLEILEDALLCKKYVDIPMGEFWYRALHPELMYYQDVRGAASAGHIYGKNIVAAESFTGGGFESPYTLKKIGDYWFTQGINRFVFHTSAHQPLDTRPGNTMVGTHINRNITWAEQAEPFMTYLSRNSFMLQQGRFVADLAYLLDEGAPSTMPVWGTGLEPSPPEGYDFDYINADVLINLMSVSDDGRLILPGGMSYALLVLPNSSTMTLPVITKLRDIIKEGATIVGPRPKETPGLSGFPGSEVTFKTLADEIWGDLDGISRTRRIVGKGKVFWGTPLKTALEVLEVRPDIEYGRPLDSKIDWIHRKQNDTDIFFLVNSSDKPLSTEVRFRVTGKEAEFWDPVCGKIEKASYIFSENTTTVPLDLEARQSVFVVFRNRTENTSRSVAVRTAQVLATIEGPWDVSFEAGLGVPEKVIFPELKSWTLDENEEIKYYSGSAIYKKEIRVPAGWLRSGNEMMIDLGKVADLAEVMVNGKT